MYSVMKRLAQRHRPKRRSAKCPCTHRRPNQYAANKGICRNGLALIAGPLSTHWRAPLLSILKMDIGGETSFGVASACKFIKSFNAFTIPSLHTPGCVSISNRTGIRSSHDKHLYVRSYPNIHIIRVAHIRDHKIELPHITSANKHDFKRNRTLYHRVIIRVSRFSRHKQRLKATKRGRTKAINNIVQRAAFSSYAVRNAPYIRWPSSFLRRSCRSPNYIVGDVNLPGD
jgi:hypothetical protein